MVKGVAVRRLVERRSEMVVSISGCSGRLSCGVGVVGSDIVAKCTGVVWSGEGTRRGRGRKKASCSANNLFWCGEKWPSSV